MCVCASPAAKNLSPPLRRRASLERTNEMSWLFFQAPSSSPSFENVPFKVLLGEERCSHQRGRNSPKCSKYSSAFTSIRRPCRNPRQKPTDPSQCTFLVPFPKSRLRLRLTGLPPPLGRRERDSEVSGEETAYPIFP